MSDDFKKLLKDIDKRYGIGSIVKAHDCKAIEKLNRIRTGMFSFDIATGGGFPIGRMLTLFGWESSGKSVIAMKTAAAFQRTCRKCLKPMFDWDELRMQKTPVKCCKSPEPMRVVWFDAERSWTNSWARKLGVDTEHTYVIRTEFAEQGIDVADAVIRSGQCDLLVVDSVAAMTPSVEIEMSAEQQSNMGRHAKLMSLAMRKWTSAQNAPGLTHELACSVILINQLRHKVGVFYGSPETQPGGNAVKFYSAIMGKTKRTDDIKDAAGRPVGIWIEVNFPKNKTAPPRRSAVLDVQYVDTVGRAAGSSDLAYQVGTLAKFWNLIRQEGSWFYLAKDIKVQGLAQVGDYLRNPDNRKVLDMLCSEVWKRELSWIEGADAS